MEGLSDLINAETEEQRIQSLQQHMGLIFEKKGVFYMKLSRGSKLFIGKMED